MSQKSNKRWTASPRMNTASASHVKRPFPKSGCMPYPGPGYAWTAQAAESRETSRRGSATRFWIPDRLAGRYGPSPVCRALDVFTILLGRSLGRDVARPAPDAFPAAYGCSRKKMQDVPCCEARAPRESNGPSPDRGYRALLLYLRANSG